MHTHLLKVFAILACLLLQNGVESPSGGQTLPPVSAKHSSAEVAMPSFPLPFSAFASPQARQAFVTNLKSPQPPAGADIHLLREFYGRFNDRLAARMKAVYSVAIEPRVIAGVRTEFITPQDGISAENQNRILINLHGGAFMWGDGSGAEVEAAPIASMGKIVVVAINYRLAPEYTFPAATEDFALVYRALLQKYSPSNIGVFGCSAGGVLTAEAIAWLDKEHLPLPGAIGTFCGSITDFDGDMSYLAGPLNGHGRPSPGGRAPITSNPYFRGANHHDPLVLPANSRDLLSRFPPTLILSGTRDFAMSACLRADILLTEAGAVTELHIWDGMWHGFFIDPDLPESKEAYQVVVRFFQRYLGIQAGSSSDGHLERQRNSSE